MNLGSKNPLCCGISQPIQTISFQTRIELHGWKLYDNIISSIPHILEEKVSNFNIKYWVNFRFFSAQPKFFLILHAFFINPWSRGKHSWLWIWGSCVRISATPFLFHRKNCWCHRDSNSRPSDPKAAILALRPRGQIFLGKKILYPILHAGRRNDHPPGEISWKITQGE